MAKRFIDTSFYKSPFVRGLKGSLKGLYSFIICDCDGAGIWSADFEIASVYVGQQITKEDFEAGFIETKKAVDLKNGKYFFPDFIQHQYPKGLSEKNPAQINIILELKKYCLLDQNLKVLESPFQGSKVIYKVKDMVEEKETVKESKADIELFEELKTEMLNSDVWIDDACRIYKKNRTLMVEYLTNFLDGIWLKKDFYKGLQEVRGHFINWLKKEIEKEKNGKQTSISAIKKF